MSEQKSEFAKGWKVLVAGLVGVACGASPLPFNTIGFVLAPLKGEFGWSYAQTSLSVTIYGIVAALLAPYFGSLADKHGVRKVAMLSTLAFGLIFAGIGAVPASIFAFYLMWFLVGLVGIGSTPVTCGSTKTVGLRWVFC
jgi:MFS transporter, OFA family, oxalate/formate antiporter